VISAKGGGEIGIEETVWYLFSPSKKNNVNKKEIPRKRITSFTKREMTWYKKHSENLPKKSPFFIYERL